MAATQQRAARRGGGTSSAIDAGVISSSLSPGLSSGIHCQRVCHAGEVAGQQAGVGVTVPAANLDSGPRRAAMKRIHLFEKACQHGIIGGVSVTRRHRSG